MHWLSIVGIGIAANLDNLGIGMSFGARSTKIPLLSNLIIAALSMLAVLLSITLGHLAAMIIRPSLANSIGGCVIMALGLGSLYKSIMGRSEGGNPLRDPGKADRDGNNIISWRESVILGFALGLNCLASGIGAGATGISTWGTTISVGVFSLMTIALGVRIGHRISQTNLGKSSNAIAGLILVGIGLYEIFF